MTFNMEKTEKQGRRGRKSFGKKKSKESEKSTYYMIPTT